MSQTARQVCKPIAIYARVSTEEQAKWSIDAQVDLCRDWLRLSLGVSVADVAAAKIYLDVATGKDTNRPGLARMMSELPDLGDVVVYRLDRLTRSVWDWCSLSSRICSPRNGQTPTVLCQSQIIDLTRPDGRAMAYMCVVFAELERETIAARTSDALAKRRGRPAGYEWLMPIIKQLRESGLSLRKIAAQVSASTGQEVAHSTVRFLLKKLGL